MVCNICLDIFCLSDEWKHEVAKMQTSQRQIHTMVHKSMFAITAIKGIGRRYANIVLKKVGKDIFPSTIIATFSFF